MIIIRFSGGLGNQLYQYALYRKFESLGIKTKGDISYYVVNNSQDIPSHATSFLLDKIFNGVIIEIANKDEIYSLKRNDSKLLKFLASKRLISGYFVEDPRFGWTTYHPRVLNETSAYVDGYWQSLKYFADIFDDCLKKELTFKNPLEGLNLETARRIESVNAVSIHIRR